MTDTQEPEVDPLQVRRPPSGLTRAERQDWREQEAERLAELEFASRPAGFRMIVATTPPRGLGRRGRKVWRHADRQARARQVAEESTRNESDRYIGAMMLAALVAIVIGWRLIFGGDAPDPAPSNPPAVTSSPAVTVHHPFVGRDGE